MCVVCICICVCDVCDIVHMHASLSYVCHMCVVCICVYVSGMYVCTCMCLCGMHACMHVYVWCVHMHIVCVCVVRCVKGDKAGWWLGPDQGGL